MKSPLTGKEMSIRKEWRKMTFRKEVFDIRYHTYRCDDTGEQFEDDAFAQLNYIQLINKYREKYSIPFPEQIIAIREKYDLTASRMSEILGFGTNSYRQYESGEVPNQSNARLIQLAADPDEFRKLLDLCNSIDPKGKQKLYHKIHAVLEEQKKSFQQREIENYFFNVSYPNSFTGYRMPSLIKFTEMVVFFTERLAPWKTKINKLLFYADFMMHKQTGFSISGVKYKTIPMGPVPNNFNSIFEYIANNDDIDIFITNFEDGGTGEQFKPNPQRKFRQEVFNEKELITLEGIAERFKNTSTAEIIKISHKEKAWIENEAGKKIIDYVYSFDLSQVN